jgi:3-dehydroquinate dehydratase/shikimate dehydrogenase
MICVSLSQLNASIEGADLVEWRLDLFKCIDIETLKPYRESCPLPLIFTLRRKKDGGAFVGSEKERLEILKELSVLKPDFIDIEIDTTTEYSSVIRSVHDIQKTPQDLESVYRDLKSKPAAYYKLATNAQTTNEALRLLCLAKKSSGKMLVMGMGEVANITRILSPIYKSPIVYACASNADATAPGQLEAKELQQRYHHATLNEKTKVFGLIGDPVTQSIGHHFHNEKMQDLGWDAVYVKMRVKANELDEFFKLAKELEFTGLSVTMPLKEAVIPYLDSLDEDAMRCQSVNTISNVNGKLHGSTTDGAATMNLFEEISDIQGKRLIIIGAGGAARSTALAAMQRGANVTMLNRNPSTQHKCIKAMGCSSASIDQIAGYDFLINATPNGMPIKAIQIIPGSIVMDMSVSKHPIPLLEEAKQRKCHCISGKSMFTQQALMQLENWSLLNHPAQQKR